MNLKGEELLILAVHEMAERTPCGLVSLSGHCTLEAMFVNVHRPSHPYSNDRTVWAAPIGLILCITLFHLLSFLHRPWLDAMICQWAHRRCISTSLPITEPQDEVVHSGRTTTVDVYQV